MQERLVNGTVPFHGTLTLLKLKSFASIKKSSKVSVRDREIAIVADRNFFARLLVISQNRKMDLQYVLSFSLDPLPLALATPQGTLRKTAKAKLLPLLESTTVLKTTPLVSSGRTAVILDRMAILQSLLLSVLTFGELAASVMNSILRAHSTDGDENRYRVDFIGDTYPAISIKSCERQSRAASGEIRTRITQCGLRCPRQWHTFMACSANKTGLVQFLATEWKDNKYATKLNGIELYVCNGSECDRIMSEDEIRTQWFREPALTCDHEEADTRMFVHAKHACSTEGCQAQTVVISSPDTDVAVIGIYHSSSIDARLLWSTGTKERRRIIDLGAIADRLGQDLVSVMPGMHAFSGCDTTSWVRGKGKRATFHLTQQLDSVRLAMSGLGNSLPCRGDVMERCEASVCHLYKVPMCMSIT